MKLSMSSFAQDRKLPDYLQTGIFDAKFVIDLQNRIPSVVIYFWNLNQCEDQYKTCINYVNNYKTNENILKTWGIASYVVVCFDQFSERFNTVTEIETLIRDSVLKNLYTLRDARELDAKLTENK